MSAYIIVGITVTDPVGYEAYKPQAAATVAAFGGRYLARGGAVDVLEGVKASRHSTFPASGVTDTRPECVRNTTCGTSPIRPNTGVA